MTHYKYLIIGGGMAAGAAIRGIREVDTQGPIGMISEDSDPPYKRPPLSKKLWTGGKVEKIWIKIEDNDVTTHLGRTVAAIDPQKKQVTDREGTAYTFEKLLIAVSGTPRTLPFASDQIIYFRTFADYKRLHALAAQRRRFAVIGGGFIASELAAALRMNGNEVVMILLENAIGQRLYPTDLAENITAFYREKGVEVLTGEEVVGLDSAGEQFTLRTKSGREVTVDGVVAGLGIQQNIGLAREAGLAVDHGILVDEYLRTSDSDIYAAGDIAEFPDPILGGRRRVEHEDNANTMGRLAGRAMAGEQAPYTHIPFFYSDLFELGYEAVGEVDSRHEIVADWKEPYRKGVLYYLRSGRVRGVLLWNVWEQVEAARLLLAEPGPFRPADLIGRLPGKN